VHAVAAIAVALGCAIAWLSMYESAISR